MCIKYITKAGFPGGACQSMEGVESMAHSPVFLPGEHPGTEEPGGLQSIGLQRVRYN